MFSWWWWLRSPNNNNDNNAREVNNDGNVNNNNNVNNDNNGAVPDLFLSRKGEKSVGYGKHRARVSEAKESLSLPATREKITGGKCYATA